MGNATKAYVVDHELAVLLKDAARTGKRLRVEAEGELLDINVNVPPDRDDIWRDYDPDVARAAWDAVAGILSDVDPDELIAEMKAAREQDSPGRRW
jgi:hypothetical protein